MHPAGEELVYRVRFTSPDGIRLERPESCTMAAGANWARLENRKDIVSGSALDFSGQGLQDAPAGKYGWLKAVGGQFELADRPGVAQRFYGVNFCGTANYPVEKVISTGMTKADRALFSTMRNVIQYDIPADYNPGYPMVLARFSITPLVYDTTEYSYTVNRAPHHFELQASKDGNKTWTLFLLDGFLRLDCKTAGGKSSFRPVKDTVYTIKVQGNKLYVDDNLIYTSGATDFVPGSEIALLSSHKALAGWDNQARFRLQSCKITDSSGGVIRDYIAVKLVRLQIGGLKDAGSPEGYRAALARQLTAKREVVDRLWSKGIRTVIDLHQGPGCAQNGILQNRLLPDYDAADLCVVCLCPECR